MRFFIVCLSFLLLGTALLVESSNPVHTGGGPAPFLVRRHDSNHNGNWTLDVFARARAAWEARHGVKDTVSESRRRQSSVTFVHPLKYVAPASPTYWGVYDSGSSFAISNYIDENANYPNQLLDWNCGTRTYDTSNAYNHRGVDMFTWPFPVLRMDPSGPEGHLTIVAAAAGEITLKQDGYFSLNCQLLGNFNEWNGVVIRHSDGTYAQYAHMKDASVTSKSVGQTVTAGEYLGIVGSSGNSDAPHLHFEVQDAALNTVDPYYKAGGCSDLSHGRSMWQQQEPYYVSSILKLVVGTSPPSDNSCPTPFQPNVNGRIITSANTLLYFTAYFRDQLSGQQVNLRIRNPSGSIVQSWNQPFNQYYASSFWFWSWFLNPAVGEWKFEAQFPAGGTWVAAPFWLHSSQPPATTTTTTTAATVSTVATVATTASAATTTTTTAASTTTTTTTTTTTATSTSTSTSTTGVACTPLTSCPNPGTFCGNFPNGCGGVVSCGNCSSSQEICNTGGQCQCVPATCSSLGAACGTHPNGCGGTLSCGNSGSCDSGFTCTNNRDCLSTACGSPVQTCAAANRGCGNLTTMCSGNGDPLTLNCGSCARAGEECSLNGICFCRDTCASLGANCGTPTACGRPLACGSCAAGVPCLLTNMCYDPCNSVSCGANEVCLGGACTCAPGASLNANGRCEAADSQETDSASSLSAAALLQFAVICACLASHFQY